MQKEVEASATVASDARHHRLSGAGSAAPKNSTRLEQMWDQSVRSLFGGKGYYCLASAISVPGAPSNRWQHSQPPLLLPQWQQHGSGLLMAGRESECWRPTADGPAAGRLLERKTVAKPA